MKQFSQRWSMRLKESRTVLTVGMWGVITLSQIIQLLKPYLNMMQLAAVAGTTTLLGVAFSYYYPEHVMKGEEKERKYRKDNFIDPKTYIYQQIDTAQMAVQSKAIAENWGIEETEERLKQVTNREIEKFFDGIAESEIKDTIGEEL